MKKLLLLFFVPVLCFASLKVGIGKTDITPPVGTPSAGYMERKGMGMKGVHDPLLAIALWLDTGEKKIGLCSVDHLGFSYEMVQEIIKSVQERVGNCEIFIGSTHTHSGGGAFLNIPQLEQSLAGKYNAQIVEFYIHQTAEAIIQASQNTTPAKVGFGYGFAGALTKYRGKWPLDISPLSDVTLIKVTTLDDAPLAVLFNYPIHPTILDGKNELFSSDLVGYARGYIQSELGAQPLFFNGAQGDIVPSTDEHTFEACDKVGRSLAETVVKIWNTTATSDELHVSTQKEAYTFKPQPTAFGLELPVENYPTEMNLLVFNQKHAFITIPGELSSIYDHRFKEYGARLGFEHVSIFGLTNDAHGYIILPESFRRKTFESYLSFGGEHYGDKTENRAISLLMKNAP